MTPQRFNEIEGIAYGLLEDARADIEDKRDIYNALRDALLAVWPLVKANGGDGVFSTLECRLPPV